VESAAPLRPGRQSCLVSRVTSFKRVTCSL
jgi:hypothetical protein